ncbi:hypothetical protein SGLAM104S_01801 [Streptomyces glaucescens]
MRALSGLWRWRRNPLCRATDLAEARLALTALLLMVLVAPLLGVLVGSATQESLHRAAREQRLTRHQVTATVLRGPEHGPPADPETLTRDTRTRVLAGWTAPDWGMPHQGTVLAQLNSWAEPGDRFGVWTDPQGRLRAPWTPPPPPRTPSSPGSVPPCSPRAWQRPGYGWSSGTWSAVATPVWTAPGNRPDRTSRTGACS